MPPKVLSHSAIIFLKVSKSILGCTIIATKPVTHNRQPYAFPGNIYQTCFSVNYIKYSVEYRLICLDCFLFFQNFTLFTPKALFDYTQKKSVTAIRRFCTNQILVQTAKQTSIQTFLNYSNMFNKWLHPFLLNLHHPDSSNRQILSRRSSEYPLVL